MSNICFLTETYQRFSICLEYSFMLFCTFVDKIQNIVTTENMKNKQSENAEDKFSSDSLGVSDILYKWDTGHAQNIHNKLSFTGASFLNLFVL